MSFRKHQHRWMYLILVLILVVCQSHTALADTPEKFSVDGNGVISMSGGTTESGETPELSYVLPRYRQVITSGLAILAITMGVMTLVMITKLGAAGDNPMLRRRAIAGIATTATATILLGGLSTYVGLLWKLLAAVE